MQSPSLAPGVRGRGIATVACLLAILLGGCGGSNPEHAQIKQVVRAYIRAQAAGTPRAACALLAPLGQAQLVSMVVVAGSGVISGRPSCPQAVRMLRAIVGRSLLASLVNVHIGRVRIHGEIARARIRDPARRFPPQVVGLEKESAGWRIAGLGR
jgi:hypothetical protein